MPYTFPSDTHGSGDSGHITDHNNLVDVLKGSVPFNVLNTAYSGGADPTGVADSTAAWQAALTAAAGGPLIVPPGTYKLSSTVTSTTPGTTIVCPGGKFATVVNYTGTGDCLRMYSTASYSSGWGGGVLGLTIDGTSASAGACGLHIGDIYKLQLDVGARNFQGTGSKGVWLDNNYFWTEQATGQIWAEQCTSHVVFDNSANTSGSATGSFDRCALQIFLDGKGKGNLVVLQNGAIIIDPAGMGIYGNTDYGASLFYVLTLTGSNSGGFSRIAGGTLNVGVECNGTTGTQPGTINFASAGSNTITACGGIMDFSANNAFANANNFLTSFQFDGPVYGDAHLQRSLALGNQPYQYGALANGNQINTRYLTTVKVTTSGNVTGIILQGFNPDTERLIVVLNKGSGTITMAAAGTSHVADGTSDVIQPNTAAMYTWDSNDSLWYRVS